MAAIHVNKLSKNMFLDSKIAEKYSCGPTKCTSVIKNMAMNTISELAALCKDSPFFMSTCGSNDCNDKKFYSILITYFDVTKDAVMTDYL